MKKKLFPFLILLFLSSCGYEALYSKKNRINYDFSISKINFGGDKLINLRIEDRLNNYTLGQKNNNFRLNILSTSKKTTIAKNRAGDPTDFKLEIVVEIDVLKDNILKDNFVIIESFDYKNDSNEFELKNYEKRVKNNLSDTVTNELIFKLSNIK
jgi:hypothetical protein